MFKPFPSVPGNSSQVEKLANSVRKQLGTKAGHQQAAARTQQC